MTTTSVLRRIIRKLTPVGCDWEILAFYTLDLQRKFIPQRTEECWQALDYPIIDYPVIDYHVIESPEDSWLAALCDAYPRRQFHLRMIHDCQQCYIAAINDQLVGYAWVTTSSCHVSEINFHLPVGPGRIYIYDCFVRADCRKQGIYHSLLSRILADYTLPRWPRRYETACIAVEPDNMTSVRGIRRVGFEEFSRISYLHLWAIERWYGARGLTEYMTAGKRRIVSD